jgi:GT2 family glycosyltransferase
MSRPSVWAVVLNHREADATIRCVASLRRSRYPDLEVLVVDNDSGPDEVARLRTAVPALVESGGNLGYAGGNNVGIRAALAGGADAVWLINPDVVVTRSALRHMVRLAGGDVGVVGCRVLQGGADIPTTQSFGGRIDWDRGGRSILLDAGRHAPRWLRGRVRNVDFAHGASMLIRREVFDEIGLLPEEYFMYFEETEFCLRAGRAGWGVVATPWADVVHHSSRAEGLPSEVYVYYFVRNRIVFGLRHTVSNVDDLVEDLDPFISGWRRRVERVDPSWLPRFEELVEMAIEDARDGVVGKREGVGPSG